MRRKVEYPWSDGIREPVIGWPLADGERPEREDPGSEMLEKKFRHYGLKLEGWESNIA